MIKVISKLVFVCSTMVVTLNVSAQRVKLLADIELAGEGLVDQTITYGSNTYTESITGMSALNMGVNIGLPFRFETSVTAGSLIKLGFNTTTSGNSTSSSSTSFIIPKVALELSRSFIWSEKKFVSGLNFGIGLERYWPQTLSASENGDGVKIKYNGATGHYYRLKVVMRHGKRFQFEPNLTFRQFNLIASDYSQTGSSDPLDPSLLNLQVRNISIGVILLLGVSKHEQ